MNERLVAWRCIGCGRLEAPRPCIGVCQDRKVELAEAADLDRALARIAELERLLGLLAHTTPRAGQCEASWRQLQERARQLLQE